MALPAFKQELVQAEAETLNSAAPRMGSLANKALGVLAGALDDDNAADGAAHPCRNNGIGHLPALAQTRNHRGTITGAGETHRRQQAWLSANVLNGLKRPPG